MNSINDLKDERVSINSGKNQRVKTEMGMSLPLLSPAPLRVLSPLLRSSMKLYTYLEPAELHACLLAQSVVVPCLFGPRAHVAVHRRGIAVLQGH